MPAPFERLEQKLDDAIEAAEIGALQRLIGEMKRRIHNEGKGVTGTHLDTFSRPRLGRYSLGHGRFRKNRGFGVGTKDLEISGSLRRSYQVGKSGDKNVIGFTFDKSRLIAEGQEQQTRQTIFAASDAEINTAQKAYVATIQRLLR